MAADALGPQISRSSAAMILIVWDNMLIVSHSEEFQLTAPY